MQRYSEIKTKMPREFLLLQGTGCKYRKCAFCDYYTDVSDNPFEVNRAVIEKVTGKYGVLDIINSGSASELDADTVELIKDTVKRCNIKTLWFESHWMYRSKLAAFAEQFDCEVKFRCGIESFDGKQRAAWNKGVPEDVTAKDVAEYFSGVCLLIGVNGQSRESIARDIELAKKYFEYFNVNAFTENTTPLKRDDETIEWFRREILPSIESLDCAKVLLNNTDLGVG